jgi:hypothetical protein
MALDKTTILTSEERRFIRDYIPALSNRPHGADMPTFMDRLMDAIDVSVAVPQAQIDAHEDGGTSKHDATEVDVEGALTYFAAGGLQASLAGADALLVAAVQLHVGQIAAPAADAAAGVAAREEDNLAGGLWVGAFTSPTVPRNATITFEAAWAGGDITLAGTDQFDAPITEVIADVAGALVSGVKVFKTITGATNELVGGGGVGHGATIGWGHKFGVAKVLAAPLGLLSVDNASEVAVWDTTYDAFTPTTLPNAAHNYDWAVSI